MSLSMVVAAMVVAAYLAGSIPIGLLVARARGIDIRAVGSGNIGATNVARSLGKKLGLIVLVFDALKGAMPMLAVQWLALPERASPFVLTACGIAAVSGHCFPVWLRFRGGKGVATALGVFLVVDPVVTAIAVAIFAFFYVLFRVASIGSMAAAIAVTPLLILHGRSTADITLSIAVTVIILVKHRQNLGRLLRHQEHRV